MKVECKFMMIMISNEPNQNNAAKPNRKFSFVFGRVREREVKEIHSNKNTNLIFIWNFSEAFGLNTDKKKRRSQREIKCVMKMSQSQAG